jgi:hypothetical protein
MGGLITFDTNGNIVANEITAKKYNVSANSESAGSGIIPAGTTSIFVPSVNVSDNSLIFTNSQTPIVYPLFVTTKVAGQGFTVELYSTESVDVNFDWWIVDKVGAAN